MTMQKIVCDHTFNYFGSDMLNGKRIIGAGVTLAVKVYKNGTELLFKEGAEPKAGNRYLSDVHEVSLNKNGQLVVTKNLFVESLFKDAYGWDKVEANITGYFINISCESNGWEEKLPAAFENSPVSESVTMTEQSFTDFLTHNKNDFGTSNDKQAQAPCIRFCNA